MQVTLSSDAEAIIDQKIRAGVFRNAEEAVAAGIMMLDQATDDSVMARRAEIVSSLRQAARDVDEGRGIAFEVEAFLAKARTLRQQARRT